MELTMYDYYLSQSEYIKRILANREAYLGDFVPFYEKLKPDRIYLCGSGTSYHACTSAKDYVEMILGIETTVVSPSSLGKLYGKNPLVIAVSQGGRSTNTVAVMDALKKKNIPVATLTWNIDTPVGKAGDCPLTLGVDDETAGPKTRGYTGTVMSLYVMALMAAHKTGAINEQDYESRFKDLNTIADMGEDNQKASKDFLDRHVDTLKKANDYMFVGKGVCAKVAGEMALKEQETLCYPANSYEFEEYLHGVACCITEGTALFLFPQGDEDDARMKRLGEIAGEVTKNVYFVTFDDTWQGENILRLQTSDVHYMAPFSSIFFAQLLSSLMPEICGRGRHPSVQFVTTRMQIKVSV
jgi:glucoselysine-6-phosphate deglycase